MKKAGINLDEWQIKVLKTKGNKCICSGRQTGKSTVVAIDAGDFAVNNPKKHVLIISVTEDQAIELLLKVQLYIESRYKKWVKKGPRFTNKTKLTLTNGSIIRTKAVGMSGVGVRGFTIDRLIADEAAFMPEDVWPAVTPMLLTTGGDIVLLSTPHGKKGYFYECYHNENFKTFHVNSVETIEKRELSDSWTKFQKDKAKEYLESEKHRLSEREFGQEYLGRFIDDLQQFFPDEYINKTLIQEKQEIGNKEGRDFVLGVDIGRLGGDKTVFIIFEKRGELLVQRALTIWRETTLEKIPRHIVDIDRDWHFKRIYLDSGGIGIGVFDTLYNTPGFKKRVVGIDNSQRVYDYDEKGRERKKKIMKEEIYANLLFLMAKKKIMIFDNGDIWLSLKSVQYEYINQRGGAMMKIFSPDHSQSHIVEAMVRAAYVSKEKILKPFISYI